MHNGDLIPQPYYPKAGELSTQPPRYFPVDHLHLKDNFILKCHLLINEMA
jgi:hypothetical protein